jgi:hypothetical protein
MLEIKDRALILRGPFKDLSDVLRIARHQGKRIFNVKKIRVDPHILYTSQEELIVKVRPEEENNNNSWKLEI